MKYLYLGNNNFGQDGSESIAELILNSKTLIELDMFNCGITEEGSKPISKALKDNFGI